MRSRISSFAQQNALTYYHQLLFVTDFSLQRQKLNKEIKIHLLKHNFAHIPVESIMVGGKEIYFTRRAHNKHPHLLLQRRLTVSSTVPTLLVALMVYVPESSEIKSRMSMAT